MKTKYVYLIAGLLLWNIGVYGQTSFENSLGTGVSVSVDWSMESVNVGEPLSIGFDMDEPTEVKTSFVNALGSKVLETSSYYPEGKVALNIETEDFEPGVYFVTMATEEDIVKETLIIE